MSLTFLIKVLLWVQLPLVLTYPGGSAGSSQAGGQSLGEEACQGTGHIF